MRAFASRIARLERSTSNQAVIVWCADPEQMPDTIADMIERGEAARGDAFIHWQSAAATDGVHEAALMELDG